MSFVTPKTWVVGEVLSASDMNTYVRDNTSSLSNGYRFVDRRIFDSAGTATFTKSDPMGDGSVDGDDITAYRIICVGGGGGGGGGDSTGAGEVSVAAAGSGGGYAERFRLTSVYPATVDVIVGSGGAGGSGSTPAGDGGDSSFASGLHICQGNGGRGAQQTVGGFTGSPPRNSVNTSPQTNAGIGDIEIHGAPGQGQVITQQSGTIVGGNGGDSALGRGGVGVYATTGAIDDGFGYGGGGGARAQHVASSGAVIGGDGADGVVIVELYA